MLSSICLAARLRISSEGHACQSLFYLDSNGTLIDARNAAELWWLLGLGTTWLSPAVACNPAVAAGSDGWARAGGGLPAGGTPEALVAPLDLSCTARQHGKVINPKT